MKKMIKPNLFSLETWRLIGKKAMYGGLILVVLGIIIYMIQDREISNISLSIIVLSYFLVWWGGSAWLFCHSLKGYIEGKIIVAGDEVAPKTQYTGRPAKIYGVIGVILALFFFSLSFVPIIVFITNN